MLNIAEFLLLNNRLIISLFCWAFTCNVKAQPPQFSIATDLDLQRNFSSGQSYWAFGHTIQGQFHLAMKDAVYVWLSYYTNGKFRNEVVATAKSPLTSPQQLRYTNQAKMGTRQFSIGWKKWLKGVYNAESSWNLYSYAGFGLLFGNVVNTHSIPIDTMDYLVPVRSGEGKFKRLTADLGLGIEIPLGAEIYLYTEARTWLPVSDYPSKYLFKNENAPVYGFFNAGIRILF
ncbi:MAG TPA: hypothetical protein VFX58_01435 [Chitinophagaceae bacterium]|nr:hypothetical protein [Chitinophagaceae bacterium]